MVLLNLKAPSPLCLCTEAVAKGCPRMHRGKGQEMELSLVAAPSAPSKPPLQLFLCWRLREPSAELFHLTAAAEHPGK